MLPFRSGEVPVADAEQLSGTVGGAERRPKRVRAELRGRCQAEWGEPQAAARIARIVRSALHQAEWKPTVRVLRKRVPMP